MLSQKNVSRKDMCSWFYIYIYFKPFLLKAMKELFVLLRSKFDITSCLKPSTKQKKWPHSLPSFFFLVYSALVVLKLSFSIKPFKNKVAIDGGTT